MGKDVDAGLAQGIEGNIGLAETAGQTLGKSVIEGIKAGLEGITECVTIVEQLINKLTELGALNPKLNVDKSSITEASGAIDGLKAKFTDENADYTVNWVENGSMPAPPSDASATYTIRYKTIGGSTIGFGDTVSIATGNFGPARSKGTLMGELGPELVVSNGRYFVAG